MATAQYETRSRTVEETIVVLALTEDEADELKTLVGASDGTPLRVRIFDALTSPAAPAPVSYTHMGTTYEMGAVYLDDTSDVWVFEADDAGNPVSTSGSWSADQTLSYVVDAYGPLRKRTP